jgi:hypothetical protein
MRSLFGVQFPQTCKGIFDNKTSLSPDEQGSNNRLDAYGTRSGARADCERFPSGASIIDIRSSLERR